MPTVLRIIIYPIFAVFCLMFFSIFLFPFDGLKNRLAHEVENELGGNYSVSIGSLSPFPMTSVILKNVEIRSRGSLENDEASIKLPKVRLSFALFPILSGGLDLDFDIRTVQGKAIGNYFRKKVGFGLSAKMDKFDLGTVGLFIKQWGVPLSGQANGTIHLEIYQADPLRNVGTVSLTLPELKLGAIPLGSGLSLPPMNLAQSGVIPSKIDVQINHGNVELKGIDIAGGDVELHSDGKVYGARMMENYRFNLKGTFKVLPETANQIPILGIIEKQKGADGFYPFTVTGRLSKPSIRIGDFKVPI
ncbi:MAG: type II secretion system protein GspN [Deltaproteobacteria bacterium]|nr:type II secretion system protein GspN [Deltaproteobacteria bacterium]